MNGTSGGWRSARTVLVPEAQSLGSVAVIRSLGRAGYRVHAGATTPDALGLASRYAVRGVVHPPYRSDGFLEWLRRYVRDEGIDAIVPSEAFLLAVRPVFAEVAPLLPMVRAADVAYAGLGKYDFFRRCLAEPALRAHVPPMLLLDRASGVPAVSELAALGAPLFVKTDSVHAVGPEIGGVRCCASAEEAQAAVASALESFSCALVQGFVPGAGVGAFAVRWNGRVLGEFMHLRVHEVPHTGGVSSLRRSFRHPEILADAHARLEAMQWDGPAMVEYRLDARTGAFHVLELNGRFWGSLHLALRAGVDFPALLLDAFFGHAHAELARANGEVWSRNTFPGEVQHVASVVRDQSLPLGTKLRSVARFARLSVDPRIGSDLWFAGDTRLYWRAIASFLRTVRDARRP